MAEQRTLSVTEAARLLGVTEKTVRQRLRTGELRGERVERPQGHVWRVVWQETAYPVNGSAGAVGHRTDAVDDQVAAPHPDRVNGSAGFRAVEALVAQLAEERRRAEAKDERITALEQERFELAGRLGYFQAQLQGKDEQIKALMAPKDPEPTPEPPATIAPRWPEEPAAPEPPRPWWRFW